MTENEKQLRQAELERLAIRCMDQIRAVARPEAHRLGMTLLLFDFGPAGSALAYCSNAVREDMIKGMKECIARLEADRG